MHSVEPLSTDTRNLAGSGLGGFSSPSYNMKSEDVLNQHSMPFDVSAYSRILQQMTKLYPYDPAAVAASLSAIGHAPQLPLTITGTTIASDSVLQNSAASLENINLRLSISPQQHQKQTDVNTDDSSADKALDLSTQGLKNLYSHYKRISMDQIKPKVVEDVWVENDRSLAWTDSKVSAYNPAQKLFMCVDCECVGFLSRVAEHWLGAHANLRVFHCPRCPYTSAWSRCVKMHLTRQHNEQFADTTMWKENATLMEVTKLMQDLRTKVETKIDANNTLADKRFYCPHCPYATDRRDLYTRHENIHKDNKPFHCYVCFKQFNRADHVKKHFVRMHTDCEYDISKIRKQPNSKSNNSLHDMSKSANQVSLPKSTVNDNREKTLDEKSGKKSPQTIVPQPVSEISVLEVRSANIMEKNTSDPPAKKKKCDKSYTCHYCNWSGSDNWCLKRHMNTHIKPFACIMCDYKAARAERLSTHVWKVHNKRICNKCNFLADTQERLLEHTREEHHNNPYSRRHICASCGMSFDTRANLETHIHLTHTRPKSPNDIVKITPITTPHLLQEAAEDLSLKRRKSGEETLCLICPVESCSQPCETSGHLANHVRQKHGGLFASRCPHCSYNLTQDELAKDHWLTHHEEVCNACVHVFTSVYGPQLWKKVHMAPTQTSGNPLDTIVSDLNKKKNDPFDLVQKAEYFGNPFALNESQSSSPSSPSDSHDSEDRLSNKRKRKQSCPKKIVTVMDVSQDEQNSQLQAKRNDHSIKKKSRVDKKKTNVKISFVKKCLRCPNKPSFSSYARLLEHKKLHHYKIFKRQQRLKIKRLKQSKQHVVNSLINNL